MRILFNYDSLKDDLPRQAPSSEGLTWAAKCVAEEAVRLLSRVRTGLQPAGD